MLSRWARPRNVGGGFCPSRVIENELPVSFCLRFSVLNWRLRSQKHIMTAKYWIYGFNPFDVDGNGDLKGKAGIFHQTFFEFIH